MTKKRKFDARSLVSVGAIALSSSTTLASAANFDSNSNMPPINRDPMPSTSEEAPTPNMHPLLLSPPTFMGHPARRFTQETAELVCRNSCYVYFDSRLLSSPETQVVLQVQISKAGVPACQLVSHVNSEPADEFYCEQAIWEAAPLKIHKDFIGMNILMTFPPIERFKTRKWNELVKQKTPEYAVVHIIPSAIHRYSHPNYPIYVDDKTNIEKISVGKLSDPLLNNFRSDWVSFFKLHPNELNPKEIEEEARHLKTKYGTLFK